MLPREESYDRREEGTEGRPRTYPPADLDHVETQSSPDRREHGWTVLDIRDVKENTASVLQIIPEEPESLLRERMHDLSGRIFWTHSRHEEMEREERRDQVSRRTRNWVGRMEIEMRLEEMRGLPCAYPASNPCRSSWVERRERVNDVNGIQRS